MKYPNGVGTAMEEHLDLAGTFRARAAVFRVSCASANQ